MKYRLPLPLFTLFVYVLLIPTRLLAQDVITGRVVDDKTGEPLPYASIYAGQDNGTLTNADGDFRLQVNTKAGLTLRFTYVGYQRQEIPAADVKEVVRLKPLNKSLTEVTVGEVEVDRIINKVIKQLNSDYKDYKDNRETYFYRLVITDGTNRQIVEAFMKANNAVNLNKTSVVKGIVATDGLDDNDQTFVLGTNMHWLIELGAQTHSNLDWSLCIKPFQNLSTTKKFFDINYEYLSSEDGENLLKMDFVLRNPRLRPHTIDPIMEGTAYLTASDLQLLRFEGKVFNLVMKDGKTVVPGDLTFRADYDHSRGFTEVANIYLEGGGREDPYAQTQSRLSYIRHSALVFHMKDAAIQETGKKTGAELLSVIEKAGYDSKLWKEYEVVRRTEDEERIVYGDSIPDELKTQRNDVASQSKLQFQKFDKRLQGNVGAWSTYVNRLEAFGRTMPQEKVYIHMDNTSYFLGDIVWFKAYVRQTNTDTPSQKSGTLYVELLNHDGYLMDRKLIELKNGEGDGYFYLPDDSTMYAGFYELRAYTRWQLNWGQQEHPHSKLDSEWFVNESTRHDYYRDYDKLYSRVFPVYNKPIQKGEYYLDMTLRPMQRQYKEDNTRPEPTLTLYPEGGNLVAGVPNRVAFEAVRTDGEILTPSLSLKGSEGTDMPLNVVNRGRGVFEITPKKGETWKVELTTAEGEKVVTKLPQPEENGVALSVKQEDDEWIINTHVTGNLNKDSLAMTIMHEGTLIEFYPLNQPIPPLTQKGEEALPAGINQVTVFDTQGRVWADRLFFVNNSDVVKPNVSVAGAKDEYQPYEQIVLDVQAAKPNGTLSLSVRDANQGSRNHDTGNILTEMLLSSEIRGFVPEPEWFFEKDDEEHRTALDLLTMTQGWRRFEWKDMAIKGEWHAEHPVERTPLVVGEVNTYHHYAKFSPQDLDEMLNSYYEVRIDSPDCYRGDIIRPDTVHIRLDDYEGYTTRRHIRRAIETIKALVGGTTEHTSWRKFLNAQLATSVENRNTLKLITDEVLNITFDTYGVKDPEYGNTYKGGKPKHDVLVHYEMTQEGSTNYVEEDLVTKDAQFLLRYPRFEDYCNFFLAASDTTKWNKKTKRKNYQWVMPREEIAPEFSVQLSYPHPRFTKPYSFYQLQTRAWDETKDDYLSDDDGSQTLRTVSVKGKKNGLSGYRYAKPAVRLDAYEAFNLVVDAGLMGAYYHSAQAFSEAVAHYFAANMGGQGDYKILTGFDDLLNIRTNSDIYRIEERRGTITGESADKVEQECNFLRYLDSVYVYTDYSPRLEGDKRFKDNAEAQVTVLLKRYHDSSIRRTYRDRYILLQGFSAPANFYNPDYSKQKLPEQKDYRRTLYWNPNLKLDKEGKAHVTLYNNSRPTAITVDAQGQSTDGTLLFSDTPKQP